MSGPTFGSLFAGFGLFDLGLERAGWSCAWQVERDPYALRVLAKHWPEVPKFDDVRGFVPPTPVDWIVGGFPCQDISRSNTINRPGIEGDNSGLWRAMIEVVERARPKGVIVENAGHWRSWVPKVRGALAALGYGSGPPLCLSAGSFGATHKRPRWFLVAHADHESKRLLAIYEEVAKLPRNAGRSREDHRARAARVLRISNGSTHRVLRNRGLGNAVFPPVAEFLGRAILDE